MPEIIPDSHLLAQASRSRNKVVLITNAAASELTKQVARTFARFGAKIVVGDRDGVGVSSLVDDIVDTGGQCVGTQCDSASWDDQLALFELAVASHECVDYVVVNAGTTLENQDSFTAGAPAQTQANAGDGDVPSKPNLEALETNLVGALYTVRLALSYFAHNPSQETTIVLVGSVGNEKGVLDVTSDHGLLGLGRAMRPRLGIKGSRIVVIAPGLEGASLLGIPLEKTTTPGPSLMTIERVAGAVVLGATDPNINVNGSVYGIVDDHQVFRIGSAELSLCDGGLFKLLFGRLQFLFELEESIWQYAKWFLGAVNDVSGRFFGSK